MSGVHDDLATLRQILRRWRITDNTGLDALDRVEAEIARLEDGLREIGRQKPDGTAARAVQIARDLLTDSPPDRPPPCECLEPNLPDGGVA